MREYVYSKGTSHGKRVQALGGAKNHMIVMPDADLDQAADALVGAAYGSAGERCMAISVAVAVGNKTADDLIAKLKPRIAALTIAPGTEANAELGPLVTGVHLERVKAISRRARTKARNWSSTGAKTSCLPATASSSALACSTTSSRR